jgi:hypothetical protein
MSAGIDIPIDTLVASFTANLWTTKNCQFYGRVFRSERKVAFPKQYEGEMIKIQPLYYVNGKAVDPLKNDGKDAQCFVDVMPSRKMFADVIEAECRVMFMVNLTAIYPALSRTESIEQVMADVKRQIMFSGFDIIQMVSGYTAFNEYGWSEDALSDLQDNHLFRYDLKLTYIND